MAYFDFGPAKRRAKQITELRQELANMYRNPCQLVCCNLCYDQRMAVKRTLAHLKSHT